MKTTAYITVFFAAVILFSNCSKDIDAPTLPQAENAIIEPGVTIAPDVLFGVWEGQSVHIGTTLQNSFEQTYRLDFQSVEDGEVLYSHWYADARTNDRDSVCNVAYSYSFDGTAAVLTPSKKGYSTMKAVHMGNNQMALYSIQGDFVSKVGTLLRTSDPEPVVTGIDRTLPQVGEKVTVTGRNLQFVDHVFLPTTDGEIEVTDFTKESKKIQFVVPSATYQAGYVRCQSTGAHVSTYSPMVFCYDCVFFHTFSTEGKSSPYTGTEFENTLGFNDAIYSNTFPLTYAALPDGHSLSYAAPEVIHPDAFLSFFGKTPVAWNVDTTLDPSTGHLRLSFGDRIQYVMDHCNGLLTEDTKCSDVAIQMDIYFYSDEEPEWNTGFISFRLDKNQNKSLTQGWFGQTAMWDADNPVSFADGWKTFTIPLSAFKVTENALYDTLGKLGSYLRKQKSTHAIIKFINYQLDATHPAHQLTSFQFNMANMRLVPYKAPANRKD